MTISGIERSREVVDLQLIFKGSVEMELERATERKKDIEMES